MRLLVQGGTLGDRAAGEQLVEVGTLSDQAEGRELGQRGPWQFERLRPPAVDPKALVVQPAGLFGDVDAQPEQLLGGARGKAVTADLVAWEPALLQKGDAQAAIRQPAGGGRTGRARPDDDDVRLLLGHVTPRLFRSPARWGTVSLGTK